MKKTRMLLLALVMTALIGCAYTQNIHLDADFTNQFRFDRYYRFDT